MTINFLTQTFTVRRPSGVGAKGDPTLGAPFTVKGRLQPGKDRNETEVTHTDVAYLALEVQPTDFVWFPGDDATDDTLARRPVSVTPANHPSGSTPFWKALF